MGFTRIVCLRAITWLILSGGTAWLFASALYAQSGATTQQAVPNNQTTTEQADEAEPRREPTPAEILRELSRESEAPSRLVRPAKPGVTLRTTVSDGAVPPNAVVSVQRRLYPDGYRIVDRPGRLTREGDYYTFSFESRGEGAPELPIRLLPNRLLEDMEIASAGGTKPVVFLISGEMTEYHGVNYLLIQKLLTRTNLGNLK